MQNYIWAVPLLPLLGFVINGALSLFGAVHLGPADPSLPHEAREVALDHDPAEHGAPTRPRFYTAVTIIGCLVVALAFALGVAIFVEMVQSGQTQPFVQTYFPWMPVGDLQINAALQVDQLSILMVLVITGIGTLIHIFSVGYMGDDPGYARYFAYLNLFVFFMLVLVLGANYPILFVGWEGVGLCSYLLIGFWFSETVNADAGKKAFIVNRIGDYGLLMAMFLMFANFKTLDYTGVTAAAGNLTAGGPLATTICLFLFLACTGKSAQIPLYVWLPDAMAGPTPVSALIHAATMVTAGVYLVVRSAALFALSPVAGLTICVVGAATALLAATIALKQWDIKKVLAYSTVSQLGFMFVAVGCGGYVAGMFHLVTHAFFKALLFLGAGSVIYALHAAYHETHNHADAQDMRNMGGLRHYMPWTWILMWIATLAISGIPLFAGFFSKDEVMGTLFDRAQDSTLRDAHWLGIPGGLLLYTLYGIMLFAAFLTAIYMTRMMLYTFHGPNRSGDDERPLLREAPWIMTGPLVVLGVLSATGGFLNLPPFFPLFGAPINLLKNWLDPVVGPAIIRTTHGVAVETDPTLGVTLGVIAGSIGVLGILLAVIRIKTTEVGNAVPEPAIERVLEHRYYVDELYDRIFVRPLVALSRTVLWKGVDGMIDGAVNAVAWLGRAVSRAGAAIQSGQVGTYAWVLVLGVLAVLGAFSLFLYA
ncbi:MAG TPA: NADH-quinone oxidoreductase subunit L [Gemmatimonadaceae bacterium]|jgi:NADH-quinone oxidoreductase subunit L|nr:NADH-quinone oxidoreductase subunit L [Gemmatimonadaceae bacterium]